MRSQNCINAAAHLVLLQLILLQLITELFTYTEQFIYIVCSPVQSLLSKLNHIVVKHCNITQN